MGIGTTSPQRLFDINGILGNSNGDVVLSAASGHRLNISGSSNYAQLVPADNTIGNPIYYEVHNQGANQGSPNGLRMGISGSNFSGVAYLDTFNGGVANTTPLALKTQGSERVRIDTNGNVGIGTTAPGARLDVLSSGTARVIAGDGCNAAGVHGGIGLGITAFSGCSNYALLGDGATTWLNAPTGNIYLRSANADKMVVTSSGNVGIGTTSPSASLQVSSVPAGIISRFWGSLAGAGDGGLEIRGFRGGWDGDVAYINFDDYNYSVPIQYTMGRISAGMGSGYPNGNLKFYTNTNGTNSEKMRIDQNGNVGIGTMVPGAKLAVAGTAGTDGIQFPDGTTQVTAAHSAYATVYRASTYTAPASNTWYDLGMTSEQSKSSNITHSNSTNPERVQVSSAGIYLLVYSVNVNSDGTAGGTISTRIYKNGTTEVAGTFASGSPAVGGYSNVISITTVVSLAASDYVTVQVASNNNTHVFVGNNVVGTPTTQSVASMTITRLQ